MRVAVRATPRQRIANQACASAQSLTIASTMRGRGPRRGSSRRPSPGSTRERSHRCPIILPSRHGPSQIQLEREHCLNGAPENHPPQLCNRWKMSSSKRFHRYRGVSGHALLDGEEGASASYLASADLVELTLAAWAGDRLRLQHLLAARQVHRTTSTDQLLTARIAGKPRRCEVGASRRLRLTAMANGPARSSIGEGAP